MVEGLPRPRAAGAARRHGSACACGRTGGRTRELVNAIVRVRCRSAGEFWQRVFDGDPEAVASFKEEQVKIVAADREDDVPGGVWAMTPEEFVNALREVVLARAVDSTLSAVEKPPGRRPRRELVEANAWYQSLSDQDRTRLRAVASMVAHQAVFGVLAVLDGVRAIESTPEKGTFKLAFRKGEKEWELNPPEGVPLHDLLNQEPESGVP